MRLPCASSRAAFFHLRAYGRTYPYSPCYHVTSQASALSRLCVRIVGAHPSSLSWPPVHVESVQDFSYVVARFWLHVLCAPRELPSMGHDPRLTIGIVSFFSTPSKKKKGGKNICRENIPALAGTSCNHCVSSALFLPFHPQRATHVWRSSSHTFLSCRRDCIPFARANFSHFVGGLGFGSGLARGSCVVGAGSCPRGPSGEDCVGREKSAATSSWTLSRAFAWRYASRSWLGVKCWSDRRLYKGWGKVTHV